jgi:hypothetical protein
VPKKNKKQNVYSRIVEKIFVDRWKKGKTEIPFTREDIVSAAATIGVALPKNLGDVIYSARYRAKAPEAIAKKTPQGKTWVIMGRGTAKYAWQLTTLARLLPNQHLATTKVPDATPQVVVQYAKGDEQALLARLRYNRLIDIFLGVAAYSLQNHLRSVVADIGQMEIDELYVGVDKRGRQYVVPVQAKGGTDELSVVQTSQDLAFCRQHYPELVCRPVAAQFIGDDKIALFELGVEDDEVKIVDERHYRLVQANEITKADLAGYAVAPQS